MNRTEFGKLVTALRKELRDDEDRCWTQKQLGKETGLGEVIIGKIERGQRVNLDSDTLSRLASALHLSSSERREFFFAAIGIDEHQIARADRSPEDVLEEMIQLIEGTRLPAFIVDGYGDIVAVNGILTRLSDVSPDFIATAFNEVDGCNIMRLVFAPESPIRHTLGHQWIRYAVYNVGFFRYITLRYRFTDYCQRLFSQLRKYPLFRQFWQRTHLDQDDYYANSEYYRYEHPKFGPLEYLATLSTALTTSGELYLVTYVPASARTAEIFANLADHEDITLLRLASWPEKPLPTV